MERRKAAVVSIFLGLVAISGTVAVLQNDIMALYFQPDTETQTPGADNLSVEVVATDLQVPWGVEFLPSGDMLVTERPGTLRRIGSVNTTYTIPGVQETGESGLLGIEKHPDFSDNRWLYLYHTRETEGGLTNRVVRYRFVDNSLTDRETIISGIPGAPYHDGGRIEFGPDGKLYVTVGDATESSQAQNPDTLHGSILRLNSDGSIPGDNPFSSPVYSYGHRNPQGLAWVDGQLWITEHGRSGLKSGMDELNIIEPGNNYGWPLIEGDETREGMETPVIHSGPDVTWAPAGAAYLNGSIYFAGLRGQSLYKARISGNDVTSLTAHLQTEYGRLRAVELGPGGEYLYVTTSNRDGRGQPAENDDRILRVDLNF